MLSTLEWTYAMSDVLPSLVSSCTCCCRRVDGTHDRSHRGAYFSIG